MTDDGLFWKEEYDHQPADILSWSRLDDQSKLNIPSNDITSGIDHQDLEGIR